VRVTQLALPASPLTDYFNYNLKPIGALLLGLELPIGPFAPQQQIIIWFSSTFLRHTAVSSVCKA
jgi:hypothetical protein